MIFEVGKCVLPGFALKYLSNLTSLDPKQCGRLGASLQTGAGEPAKGRRSLRRSCDREQSLLLKAGRTAPHSKGSVASSGHLATATASCLCRKEDAREDDCVVPVLLFFLNKSCDHPLVKLGFKNQLGTEVKATSCGKKLDSPLLRGDS